MEKRVDAQKTLWITYVMVFIITVGICCLRLFTSVEMKLVTDNIGCMFVPSYLAGRDWSDMISWISYYGWLYYVIYTPLFLITENPYIIYYTICIGNVLVLGLLSVLIYHCTRKYFGMESKATAVAMAILCSTYAIIVPSNFSNELPSLVVVWIIVYLLLKLHQYNEKPTKKNLFTVILLFVLMCSISVHTRLVVMWIILFPVIFISFFVYKKWFVNPWIFTFGSAIAYAGGIGMKSLVVNLIWQAEGLAEVKNTTLNLSGYVKVVDTSVKVVADIIISNLYKLNMQTHGIAIIAIVIVFAFVFGKILNLIKVKNVSYNKEIVDESESVFFTIGSLFLFCLFGTICALPLYYGSGIATGYDLGVENARFSAFTYLRYYLQYFGPVFLCAYVLIVRKKEYYKWAIYVSVLTTVLLALYVVSCVLPHLSVYYTNFILKQFFKDDTYRINFAISVVIILFLVVIWNFLFYKQKEKVVLLCLVFVFISGHFINLANPFMNITLPTEGDSAYSVLSVADDEIEIPHEIYCMNVKKVQSVLQILLNEYSVKLGEPDDELSVAIAVTSAYDSVGTDVLLQQGYRYWILDNNECLWVKGKQLQEDIEPYIVQYISKERKINEKDIALGEEATKILGVIFQSQDGVAATATMQKPVCGEYIIDISMNALYMPVEDCGMVEILLDGEVAAKSNIVMDQYGRATVSIPVYIGYTEKCEIKCSLTKNTIINDFYIMTKCVDSTWVVGAEDVEELDEIARVMEKGGLDLPVSLIGYNNPYSNVNLSIMEKYIGVDQLEVVDSRLVKGGKFNDDCFLLLQNNHECQLIFELVEKYIILWRTPHYTLLVCDTEYNRRALNENDCLMMSVDGAIDVNYFRIDSNGELKNDILLDLPEGAYGFAEYHNIDNISYRHDTFSVNKLNETGGAVIGVYNALLIEEQDMLVGKQTVSVSDGELCSFNWYRNAIDIEMVSQAFVSKCEKVYQSGDVIDFSTAGECPFYNTGFAVAEEWGVWSTEIDTTMELNVKYDDSIKLDINMWAYVAQDVTLSVNGIDYVVFSVGENVDVYSVTIPAECIQDGKIKLVLRAERLCSPNERDGSPDMRKLGIAISKIQFE